ncbi:MAG: hypothetical protein QXH57_03785, partial [Sulfolobales archaeon]
NIINHYLRTYLCHLLIIIRDARRHLEANTQLLAEVIYDGSPPGYLCLLSTSINLGSCLMHASRIFLQSLSNL